MVFYLFIAVETIYIVFVQWITLGPMLNTASSQRIAEFVFFCLMEATAIVQVIYWIAMGHKG
jgi:hypothetical protein